MGSSVGSAQTRKVSTDPSVADLAPFVSFINKNDIKLPFT